MKLLEIVPTDKTAPETLATGFSLARLLKKIPVPAQSNSYVVMEEIKESTVIPTDR